MELQTPESAINKLQKARTTQMARYWQQNKPPSPAPLKVHRVNIWILAPLAATASAYSVQDGGTGAKGSHGPVSRDSNPGIPNPGIEKTGPGLESLPVS